MSHGSGVEVTTDRGGERLFLLTLSSTGDGSSRATELSTGEEHVVAFEDAVSFEVRRVGGLKSTPFSGEGLVCEFEGPGTDWVQSRSQNAFVRWFVPQLSRDSDGGVQFSSGGGRT